MGASSGSRREPDMEAVQGLRINELAGQAGRRLEKRHGVEHRLLVVICRVELVGPVFGDHDMAGGAGTGPAADPAGFEAMVADDLHHPPAFDRVELVRSALQISHANHPHECLFSAAVLSIELAFLPENRLTTRERSTPLCIVRYSEHLF